MKGWLHLKGNQSIKKLIEQHVNDLSKKQQNIATFILNNFKFVGTHSAAEVGKRTKTSETTVIRFCYALGLEGYAQLQREITVYLFNEHASVSTLGNYVASTKDLVEDEQLIKTALHQDMARIDRIAQQIDLALFNKVTKLLHEAKHVYIAGNGASKFAADWFHFTLNILRSNVSVIPDETPQLIRTIQEVEQDDVMIVISQHRYTKESIQLAQAFYEQGVNVIAITDSQVAPIHDYASFSFVLEQAEQSTIDLMPVLISFLNGLMTGMMTFDPEYYEEQRVNFDDIQYKFIEERWS